MLRSGCAQAYRPLHLDYEMPQIESLFVTPREIKHILPVVSEAMSPEPMRISVGINTRCFVWLTAVDGKGEQDAVGASTEDASIAGDQEEHPVGESA